MSADHIVPNIGRLTDVGEGSAVVVVDFVPFSSAERLGQLLCRHSAGHQIYQIDPVTDLTASSSYIPLPDLAKKYAGALEAAHVTDYPALVVGYCSAASLALHIVSNLAQACDVAPILVTPTRPGSDIIAAYFQRFRADLGATEDARLTFDGQMHAVLDQMTDTLRRDLQSMAVANGFDVHSAALAEMLSRYRSWLAFLLASIDPASGPLPGQLAIPVIMGSDDSADLHWLPPGHSVSQIPATSEDFATSPALAEAILSHCP